MGSSGQVDHVLVFVLHGPESQSFSRVSLSYSEHRPWQVSAAFDAADTSDNSPAVWVFARDLLTQGLFGQAGHGDVRVRPTGQHIAIEFHDGPDYALITVQRAALAQFLDSTYTVVPLGDESRRMDWHEQLAALLA